MRIDGLGNADPVWADAHYHLVKETLLQAIGRGRGVNENSVPVLVTSNESLGLALAKQPLHLVNDAEDNTLRLTVPQSISPGLTQDHVLRTLADLDGGIGHPFE